MFQVVDTARSFDIVMIFPVYGNRGNVILCGQSVADRGGAHRKLRIDQAVAVNTEQSVRNAFALFDFAVQIVRQHFAVRSHNGFHMTFSDCDL